MRYWIYRKESWDKVQSDFNLCGVDFKAASRIDGWKPWPNHPATVNDSPIKGAIVDLEDDKVKQLITAVKAARLQPHPMRIGVFEIRPEERTGERIDGNVFIMPIEIARAYNFLAPGSPDPGPQFSIAGKAEVPA